MEIFALFCIAIAYFAVSAFQRNQKKTEEEFQNRLRNARVITFTIGPTFSVTFNEMDLATGTSAIEKAKAYLAAHPDEKLTIEYRWPE
jgi:preprotein translocase subunit YajC